MISTNKLLNTINTLKQKPKLIITEYNYNNVSFFIFGYLKAFGDFQNVDYNINFSNWLQARYKDSTSVIWSSYIYERLAKEDEKLALNILLDDLSYFFEGHTP